MSRNNFQISVKRFRARNLDTGNGRSIRTQGGTQKAQWGTLKFYGEPRSANKGTANTLRVTGRHVGVPWMNLVLPGRQIVVPGSNFWEPGNII